MWITSRPFQAEVGPAVNHPMARCSHHATCVCDQHSYASPCFSSGSTLFVYRAFYLTQNKKMLQNHSVENPWVTTLEGSSQVDVYFRSTFKTTSVDQCFTG